MNVVVLLSLVWWAIPTTTAAGLQFSHLYTDSMILQRGAPASIWGWAGAHDQITVSLIDQVNTTIAASSVTANAQGRWRVSLPPQPSSTKPMGLVAFSSPGGTTAVVKDVLFGDVYVCSGQSNMAFSVATPTNDEAAEAKIAQQYATDPGASPNGTYITADETIKASSNYPNLRFLVVGNKHDCLEPIEDYYPSPGNDNTKLAIAHPWQKASPSSIGGGLDVMGGNGAGEMSAVCYNWGLELHTTQQVPIGLIHTSYGGSAVEDWISKETLGDGTTGPCPGNIIPSMGLPSQQWNGQLRPLLNTTIKGVIWYQGEANWGQNELYACRYEQMMEEWRAQWHIGTDGATDPNFPIGFVQIGPMTFVDPLNSSTFAIRMGQTAGYGYAPNKRWPHSFMAAAFDLANPPNTSCYSGCIHVFNKQAVAHRLAVAARSMIYGERDLIFSGPRVTGATADMSSREVTVTYCAGCGAGSVTLRGTYGFEMSDGSKWYPVNITSSTSTTVVLPVPAAVASVAQLRYAWEDVYSVFTDTGPAVFNEAGLPATPSLVNVTTS